MQFLIVSDIHANWHALQAVLEDAKGEYSQVVCCGDLVGYNPSPAAVIDWTSTHCSAVVRGNHDKVVAGVDDIEWFNDVAKTAARWTMRNLNEQQLGYLKSLPEGPDKLEHFEIWHGSPKDEDEYVIGPRDAASCFDFFDLPLAFFGHTHLQGGFLLKSGRVSAIPAVRKNDRESIFVLHPDAIAMINPGSVGQPRDGDRRAAYALFEPEGRTVTLRRVEYPIQKTADEIKKAGLPDVLGLRLFQGM